MITKRRAVSQGAEEGRLRPLPPRLYTSGKFQTPDGKAKLFAAEWERYPEQPSEAFPFVLNTGRTVEHWHTRTKTKEVKILERMSPKAWLEMNPRDARRLGLKPHDLVTVASPRGRIENLELRITEIVAPGQVFMPFQNSRSLKRSGALPPVAKAASQSAASSVRMEPPGRRLHPQPRLMRAPPPAL